MSKKDQEKLLKLQEKLKKELERQEILEKEIKYIKERLDEPDKEEK